MLTTQRLRRLLLVGVLLISFTLLVTHRQLIRILRATPRLALFPADATPLPAPHIIVAPEATTAPTPRPSVPPTTVAPTLAAGVPGDRSYRVLLPHVRLDGPWYVFLPVVLAGSEVEPLSTPPVIAEPPSPGAPVCAQGNYSCVRERVATTCMVGNFTCLRQAAPWLPSGYDPWRSASTSAARATATVDVTPVPAPTSTPAPTPDDGALFDLTLAELNPSLPADLSLATSPAGYDGYVNSYDYFLSKHTEQALGGLHSMNQVVGNQQSFYMKGRPDRFELHTLGDFIRLKEDHSGAPNPPYTFSDGRWMPREWKPGDILDVRADENTLQFYDENCQPTYAAAFGYTMRFVALMPNVNLGGVLGIRSKVLVLEYRYYTDREIFLYDSEEGWVAWQLYQKDQLTQEVRFNRPPSMPILPDLQSVCVLR